MFECVIRMLQEEANDATCGVCMCEVPLNERYIMEPCGHAYCR